MPIGITCGNCGGKFNAPDAAAGRRGKCPKCGEAIAILATTTEPPPLAEKQVELLDKINDNTAPLKDMPKDANGAPNLIPDRDGTLVA